MSKNNQLYENPFDRYSFQFAKTSLNVGIIASLVCSLLIVPLGLTIITAIGCWVFAAYLLFVQRYLLSGVRSPVVIENTKASYYFAGFSLIAVAGFDSGNPDPFIHFSEIILISAISLKSIRKWFILLWLGLGLISLVLSFQEIENFRYIVHLFLIIAPASYGVRRVVFSFLDQFQIAYQKELEALRELGLEQQRREETQRQLFDEKRRASLGTLAAGVAHDFNNFLTVIVSSANLIPFQNSKSEIDDTSRHIIKTAQSASSLCQEMMLFAGKSVSDASVRDLTMEVDQIRPLVMSSYGKNCSIEFKLSGIQLLVMIESHQLKQAILNLIANAVDAASEVERGTRMVRVETTSEEYDVSDPHIVARGGTELEIHSKIVCLKVFDNGNGLPPNIASQVFEPYFTTKEDGHGFGMSSTLGIMEMHGGAIHIKRKDDWTVVELIFPAAS